MSQVIGTTNLAFSRVWHVVNVGADMRSLGRLASAIAITLMGKHKPVFHPSNDCGDYVVAVGCHDLRVTGKKRDQKMYYKHTTRPGVGFKQMNMNRIFTKFGGGEVLRRAVSGMLPKNRLREIRLARLKVFEGLHHPFKKNLVLMAPTSNRKAPNTRVLGPIRKAEKVKAAASQSTDASPSITSATTKISV